MGMTRSLRLAKAILNGFDSFFGDFQNVTLGAQARFEKADWNLVQAEMSNRLSMYKKKVAEVAAVAETVAGDLLGDPEVWEHAKLDYADIVETHSNYEIAQTFFNSVYCFIFKHRKIRDKFSFVFDGDDMDIDIAPSKIFDRYKITEVSPFVRSVLASTDFNVPFEDFERDVQRVAEILEALLGERLLQGEVFRAEILESLFYRNKAAYLVGRIIDGEDSIPFVLPFMNNECGGVYVDTVLNEADDVSILFSFTRSYFMVDASVPSQFVAFLKKLMPQKEVFELYSALGFARHAKTVFFRRAVWETMHSDDEYVTAPGIKGMVMLVFTRPGFDYVYKVIKDRFTPPKDMTRAQVEEKYVLVKRWDRAGRMADTQEFKNLVFDRRRFSDELMAELMREVPSLIEELGNVLILKHVYVERKMVPLNLYLKDASDQQVEGVMDEYGNAIKQLAAVNIFPGDMLLKNFGVTRHGRVVFYDYDEICPLVDCNFRKIPQPQTEEQEMASGPWYNVAPNDVFPEEFRLFFSGNQRAREVFDRLHSDIYQAEFWQRLQRQIRNGQVKSVFPYRRKYSFKRPLKAELAAAKLAEIKP
ncbi:bifunctional isocitrate dehydrogenase kinase/phosphatase [Dasania marina]|uniref:bifunctional isocitrate dehydrogenase kinase/phosphatase n=1 Tax=Dasania marina TaxID=471499 RepID=UPI0030D6D09F|tara:strand:+ start:99546 stop:101309 length:1764 start_codon:yes stop_codon:yes gene_type:complete